MEETNITNCTSQPIKTPSINPITPNSNNIYKYLFFISLIILFGVIAYFTTTNNKNSQPLINNINNIVKTTPIEIVEEKNKENEEGQDNINTEKSYKTVSIEDDKNSVSKLVLIDQDNNEIVIDEAKYWYMAEHTLKPSYEDFIFSPNNNFLYYNRYSGYEEASSYIYDLAMKKTLQLDFFAETKGFTLDSKYFYACSEAGMNGGGAIVRDLISSNNIYNSDDEGDDSNKCIYDKELRELTIYKTSTGEKILLQKDNFHVFLKW